MFLDFLEIGTGDFNTLMQSEGNALGMSIEPVECYLDRLPNKKYGFKVNCAISNYDGEIDIFYIDPEKINELGLPRWVRGCNSVNNYHPTVITLLQDRKFKAEDVITQERVSVKKLSTLINEYNIEGLRRLKVEAEGHDCIILSDYLDDVEQDSNLPLPHEIIFSSNVLSNQNQIEDIKSRLNEFGFRLTNSGDKTRLVRKPEIAPWQRNEIKVTAIVLNWKRLDNLKTIVRQFSKRRFISEVLIWNNNPIEISFKDLGLDQHHDWLTIVNSKENLKDEAKYLAASQAKNEHVFYQDDDWSTAHYIDAMYGAYCINPTHLHVAVGELSWAESQFRSFYNVQNGLQSEFYFIGCGSFFPRSFAKQHLKYINKFYENAEKSYADVSFTMFLNQPVIKLQVGLSAFSQENAFSSEDNFLEELGNLKKKTAALLMNFAQEKKVLPLRIARSAYKNVILFTSYIPKELDQSRRVFDPQDLKQVDERMKPNPSEGASSVFRKYPYFNAIADISKNKDHFWRTGIDVNDEWGFWLCNPMRVKLKINEVGDDSLSSLWYVKVDDKVQVMTLKQLSSFNAVVHSELHVSCVDTPLVLKIKADFVLN